MVGMKEDTFSEKILRVLKEGVTQYGSATALAKAAGVSNANLSRWINKIQSPRMSEISPLLDVLKINITKPDAEASRDVCFVNAKVVPAGQYATPPVAEDYIAAPMVGEVGAGPGYLPEDEVKSWFLAYKNLPAIRHRRNLIAVEIGPTSTSMQPTLNPGDIVLVDRDDRDVTKPGHMMLVLDPDDGSGMGKRVSVTERKDDFQVTYYSDNGSKWPPMIYSLKQDFCDDWDKAIVGRVIWAWADVREK